MEDITPIVTEMYSTEEQAFIYKVHESLEAAQERLATTSNPATRILAHAVIAYRSWQLAPYNTEM